MKLIQQAVLALLCAALGAVAGFKYAKVAEHNRLERNKTLARLTHDVWSEANDAAALSTARKVYAADFVVHNPIGGSHGFDAFFQGLRENRAYFPNWTEKVESIVAEGDLVAVLFTSKGTQARDLSPIPHVQPLVPNRNRSVTLHETEIYRVADGKLAEQWDLWDGWDFYGQLGLFNADQWPESVCGTR